MINYSILKGETKLEYRNRIISETKREAEIQREKLIKGELKVSFDVDDLGFLLEGIDDLLRLKKSLPNLKMTCFTIPLSSRFFNSQNAKHFKWESYKRWAKMINEMDWLEIAIHGFAHVKRECDVSYDKSVELLRASENLFERVGLEYVKLIKAPYWQMSYDFLVACRDEGYVVAIDKNHMRPVPQGLQTYIYNWSYEEKLPIGVPIIKGHGHFIGDNANNIKYVMDNILTQIPKETKFMFVSEYLKEYGNDTKTIEKIYAPDSRETEGENKGTDSK